MRKMKKEEVEALLRTFLKGMANMKLMRPFTTWLDLVGGRKSRSIKDQMELERYKRLKVFLEAKLKGVKFATFKALHREYLDLKKSQMLNNDRAKKVAQYLEMIARGLQARLFGAFKRYQFLMKAERDEEARLAALIAERDSQSLQRLKIFLGSKEKRMKYGGFSWWANCTFNSKTKVLLREVEKAKAARIAAEKACDDLKKQM